LDNENPSASATGGHFQGLNDSGGKTVKMMRKNRRGINPSMHLKYPANANTRVERCQRGHNTNPDADFEAFCLE